MGHTFTKRITAFLLATVLILGTPCELYAESINDTASGTTNMSEVSYEDTDVSNNDISENEIVECEPIEDDNEPSQEDKYVEEEVSEEVLISKESVSSDSYTKDNNRSSIGSLFGRKKTPAEEEVEAPAFDTGDDGQLPLKAKASELPAMEEIDSSSLLILTEHYREICDDFIIEAETGSFIADDFADRISLIMSQMEEVTNLSFYPEGEEWPKIVIYVHSFETDEMEDYVEPATKNEIHLYLEEAVPDGSLLEFEWISWYLLELLIYRNSDEAACGLTYGFANYFFYVDSVDFLKCEENVICPSICYSYDVKEYVLHELINELSGSFTEEDAPEIFFSHFRGPFFCVDYLKERYGDEKSWDIYKKVISGVKEIDNSKEYETVALSIIEQEIKSSTFIHDLYTWFYEKIVSAEEFEDRYYLEDGYVIRPCFDWSYVDCPEFGMYEISFNDYIIFDYAIFLAYWQQKRDVPYRGMGVKFDGNEDTIVDIEYYDINDRLIYKVSDSKNGLSEKVQNAVKMKIINKSESLAKVDLIPDEYDEDTVYIRDIYCNREGHSNTWISNNDGTHFYGCEYCEYRNDSEEDCEFEITSFEDGSYTNTCSKCGYEDVHSWGDVDPEDASDEGYTVDTVPNGIWYAGIPESVAFNNKSQTFDFRLYYGTKKLIKDKDYSVTYTDNKNKGTAKLVISGKGNYSFSLTKNFTIEKFDISEVSVEPVLVQENGEVQKCKVEVSVIFDGKKVVLTNGTDYTLTYPKTNSKASDYDKNAFKAPGEYEIIIKGKGNYIGQITAIEKIIAKKDYTYIGATTITVSSAKYSKEAATSETGIVPTVTIKKGSKTLKVFYSKAANSEDALAEYEAWNALSEENVKDFVCFFENNRVASSSAKVTIVGIESRGFLGTKTLTFKITGKAIKEATFSKLSKKAYTGEAVYQEFTVKTSSGKTTLTGISAEEYELLSAEAKRDYNYIYKYKSNINKGKASIVFTGVNGYTGTVTKTFEITAYNIEKDQKKASEEQRITYCFSETETKEITETHLKGGAKPEVTVKFLLDGEWVELVKGTDYTVSYLNNTGVATSSARKAPTAQITGKGNFSGSLSMKFTIVGADISGLTISAPDKVASSSKGGYKSSVKIVDTDGKTLEADKDYNKTLKYYYVNKNGTRGAAISSKAKVPADTLIWVETTGKKNYSGTIHTTYRIAKYDISKAEVTVATKNYTGNPIVPTKSDITEIRIKVGSKYVTIDSTQYEIIEVYSNVNAGKGKMVIKGVGDFCGTKTVSFTIKSQNIQ